MRKALVVGIDYYAHASPLFGCVSDAHAVKGMLERHGDGSVNFDVRTLTSSSAATAVTRAQLKEQVRELFSGAPDTAVLFFAGHGYVEDTGGYLLASDSKTGDEGLPLGEVLTLASASKATNRIVLLDSCHSGVAGDNPLNPATAELSDGLTILTASTAEQYATEVNGRGVFTSLLVDALSGAACNLVGDVTPGGVYAHVDQSLGSWEQRPVFKTNVKRFVSLRKVHPPVSPEDLRRIAEFFPSPGYQFALDPSFEPERGPSDGGMAPPDPANTSRFAILQKLNRVNLVVPIDAPHMYHAAVQSKACKLTALGEHYRRLAVAGRI